VMELGVLDGVVTTRAMFVREDVEEARRLGEICQAVGESEVHAEVAATDARGMVEQGMGLSRISPRIVVKLPAVKAGMKAAKVLSGRGIAVNITLCFQPPQAMLAAKAGARWVSPLIVPAETTEENNTKIIGRIRKIYDNYGFETGIIAAGNRSPLDLMQVALAGADGAVAPFAVFEQMLSHPPIGPGLKAAVEEWGKRDTARLQ
jgi:transaldolase